MLMWRSTSLVIYTPTMAIPAFLTSGASSRAHHALIVALHDARSNQEEHTIALAEVQRIRDSFAQPSSTARFSQDQTPFASRVSGLR